MALLPGYTREAVVAMFLYSLASSSLLLINKACLRMMPLPSTLSALQFATSAATAEVLMATGSVPRDKFVWHKVKPYLYYVGLFVLTIYCNMRALQNSNVETIIVFRACCPLFVCLLDWAFLGRQLPNRRSTLALFLLGLGCAGYVASDRAFRVDGWGAYKWVTTYFVIISVEMAYGKHIVGPQNEFASMWGPTLYTNALSLLPMLAVGVASGEPARMGAIFEPLILTGSTAVLGFCVLITLSCIVGCAISYLGWRARSLVTATCYTVLGVTNKMVCVLVNALLWEQRASPAGVACLTLCLFAALGYEQAPLRAEADGYGRVRG